MLNQWATARCYSLDCPQQILNKHKLHTRQLQLFQQGVLVHVATCSFCETITMHYSPQAQFKMWTRSVKPLDSLHSHIRESFVHWRLAWYYALCVLEEMQYFTWKFMYLTMSPNYCMRPCPTKSMCCSTVYISAKNTKVTCQCAIKTCTKKRLKLLLLLKS